MSSVEFVSFEPATKNYNTKLMKNCMQLEKHEHEHVTSKKGEGKKHTKMLIITSTERRTNIYTAKCNMLTYVLHTSTDMPQSVLWKNHLQSSKYNQCGFVTILGNIYNKKKCVAKEMGIH